MPLAFGAGVKVKTPVGETVGAAENNDGLLLLVTEKVRAWLVSSAGPALIAVAQLPPELGEMFNDNAGR